MAPRDTAPAAWGETLWIITGAFVTVALAAFIITGAFAGWFG